MSRLAVCTWFEVDVPGFRFAASQPANPGCEPGSAQYSGARVTRIPDRASFMGTWQLRREFS